MVRYSRAEVALTEAQFEEISNSKMRLTDGDDMPENIWIKRLPDGRVSLLNHALGLYPFPSWGSVHTPVNGEIDVEPMKNAEPSIIELLPWVFDEMVSTGMLSEAGEPQDKMFENGEEDEEDEE
jgi:hypothetical protein